MKKPIRKSPSIWLKVFYKEYPRFDRILLPSEEKVKRTDLFQTILTRESVRKFSGKRLSLVDISKLLFYSAGINRLGDKEIPAKRTYPSGGARYPLEIYLIIKKNTGELKPGIYHYNVKYHALEVLFLSKSSIDMGGIIEGVNREIGQSAPAILAITTFFSRTEIKYGRTAYKHILLETGHLAQNIYLVSQGLGLGCCAMGGFIDEKINNFLQLDPEKEQTLYLIALGKR